MRFVFSVWYTLSENITVWSANAGSPIAKADSLLITAEGQLVLVNSSRANLWPQSESGNSTSTSLFLREDGNLVYGSWESFGYPTNTILPNQTISGNDLISNNGKYKLVDSRQLVFAPGNATYGGEVSAFDKFREDGTITQAGGSFLIPLDFGKNRLRRLTLDDDGNMRIYSFDPDRGQWIIVWKLLQQSCKIKGTCGANSICFEDYNSDSTNCVCPPGFRRSKLKNSCERKIAIKDSRKMKFLNLDYVSFINDGSNQTSKVKNFSVCKASCRKNPRCLGFGFKFQGEWNCGLLLDELSYGYWSPGTEMATYLRVAEAESDISNFTGMTTVLNTTCPVRITLPLPLKESDTTTRNVAIICTLFAAELISGVLFFRAFLKKYSKYRDMARTFGLELFPAGAPKRFTFAELKAATNDFSNLVGKGGFGDVYKGEFPDGRVVAVKFLKFSTGGDADFWAEVTIIARMHHLNLVRLWGFCAEKGKRILVYEYVPNGSLDKYLFRSGRVEDPNKPILDWGIRYRIALGVARVIAYLHEECLEWVLHCDIKPENILLGDDFCPKISDFGLAKLKKKENMVSMCGNRGTRGYMAPEWLKSDPITPKADVYSFGMVLLEIVSGFRHNAIQGGMNSEEWYFPRWAFDKAFKEMRVEDILDSHLQQSYDSEAHFDMVNRMVKTAIWCLQDRPEMRPSMGKVAKMLEGTVEIIEPSKPTIFFLGDE